MLLTGTVPGTEEGASAGGTTATTEACEGALCRGCPSPRDGVTPVGMGESVNSNQPDMVNGW